MIHKGGSLADLLRSAAFRQAQLKLASTGVMFDSERLGGASWHSQLTQIVGVDDQPWVVSHVAECGSLRKLQHAGTAGRPELELLGQRLYAPVGEFKLRHHTALGEHGHVGARSSRERGVHVGLAQGEIQRRLVDAINTAAEFHFGKALRGQLITELDGGVEGSLVARTGEKLGNMGCWSGSLHEATAHGAGQHSPGCGHWHFEHLAHRNKFGRQFRYRHKVCACHLSVVGVYSGPLLSGHQRNQGHSQPRKRTSKCLSGLGLTPEHRIHHITEMHIPKDAVVSKPFVAPGHSVLIKLLAGYFVVDPPRGFVRQRKRLATSFCDLAQRRGRREG